MNVFLRPVLIPYIIPQHNEAYPYRGVPPRIHRFYTKSLYIIRCNAL